MYLTKELIELYIKSSKTRGLSNHTIRAYNGDLQSLLRWSNKTAVEYLEFKILVETWLNWQTKEEKSPRTRKRRVATVKAYSLWLIMWS